MKYIQEISRRRLPATIRAEYDRERHDARLPVLRTITLLLALFYFSYTAVDAWFLPDIAWRTFILRFSIIGPLTILLLRFYRQPVSIRLKEGASVLVVCIATVVWCVAIGGTASPVVLNYFYAALVFQMVVTIVLTPPLEYGVAASAVVTASVYTTIWFLPDATTDYVLFHLAVGVPTVVLTLIANYRFSTEAVRLYLQNKDLDRLHGQLLKQHAELELVSQSDPLTGLTNRRSLDAEIHRLIAASNGTGVPVTVLLLDIDHFKEYNDRFGHLEGDECLKLVADALKNLGSDDDLACRFGGEEFLILRPGVAPAASIRTFAEEIRQAVEALSIRHPLAGRDCLAVTVSVGASADIVTSEETFLQLIAQADEALYTAKRHGRNISLLHQSIR